MWLYQREAFTYCEVGGLSRAVKTVISSLEAWYLLTQRKLIVTLIVRKKVETLRSKRIIRYVHNIPSDVTASEKMLVELLQSSVRVKVGEGSHYSLKLEPFSLDTKQITTDQLLKTHKDSAIKKKSNFILIQ